MPNILVIDDEEAVRRTVIAALRSGKHKVLEASNVKRAFLILQNEAIDLVVSDLRLPDGSGIESLQKIKSEKILCDVIIMTGYATIDTAVQAMKEGANDYITKPFNPTELTIRIEKVLKQKQLTRKVHRLEQKLQEKFQIKNIVSVSRSMQLIMQQVRSIAPTDSSVMITGESGTGKELIANAIHLLSARAEKPFVAVNCGALPETLLESELFGHMKGAFTGATNLKQGLLETSDGGTLLLDEIGDASLSVQVKLLRVLENGTMRRIGDTQEKSVNIRLLAATNKDLQEEILENRFRQDLFFRINVIPIHLPPLRERIEDIPLLADFFLKKHSSRLKKRVKEFDSNVLQILMNHTWPGNIRELENTIEYATAMCDANVIQINHLPITLQKNRIYLHVNNNKILSLPEVEKRHILHVLEQVNWNQRRACELMQISKVTLYRRLKDYGIKSHKKQ